MPVQVGLWFALKPHPGILVALIREHNSIGETAPAPNKQQHPMQWGLRTVPILACSVSPAVAAPEKPMEGRLGM